MDRKRIRSPLGEGFASLAMRLGELTGRYSGQGDGQRYCLRQFTSIYVDGGMDRVEQGRESSAPDRVKTRVKVSRRIKVFGWNTQK